MAKFLSKLVILIAFTTVASTSFAQDGGEPSIANKTSISFGVPGGGSPYAAGTAGIFYAFSDQFNMGFNVGLRIDTETEPDSTFNLLLAPTFKYYMFPNAKVSPFYLGQLNFGFTSVGEDAVDLTLVGGFGAEWWVTDIFSLAAYVALGLDILRPNDVGPLAISTIPAGLSAQIYF